MGSTASERTSRRESAFLDYLVEDVMSEPVGIAPETRLVEVERILEERRFNSLPVVSLDARSPPLLDAAAVPPKGPE